MFTFVSNAFAVVIAAAVLFGVARAYRTLENVELLALWWWAAIGLFVGLNVRGIADRLARRRMGLWPFNSPRSSAAWRLSGFGLVVIGAGWTLAFTSVF